MTKTRNLAGLELSVTTGSKRKQMLSNRVEIRVPGDRSDVQVRLTIRQARALQRLLNETL